MTRDPIRRALVVGASRGLGLGLAQELLAQGWDVTATVRRAAPALVPSQGLRVESGIDIDDDAAVARLHDSVASAPKFDLVFVVAGVATQAGTPAGQLPAPSCATCSKRMRSAPSVSRKRSTTASPTTASWR